jgi:hypothetical protein
MDDGTVDGIDDGKLDGIEDGTPIDAAKYGADAPPIGVA